MNDVDYTDYGSFYEELMSGYEELEQVARDKLEWERHSLAQLPLFGVDGVGDADSGDFEAAREKLDDFVANRCSGDHAALETMIDGLSVVGFSLNGETQDGQLVGGIDAMIGDIHAGLGSWNSVASEAFVGNYVDTIGSRKGNQVLVLEQSMGGLEAAKLILTDTRKAVVQMVDDITGPLRSYSPQTDSFLVGVDLALTAASFVPGGVGATALIAGSSKVLPKASGLSVQGILEHVRTALIWQTEEVVSAENYLIEKFGEYNAEETADWTEYVCSKPVETVPAYHHG